MGSHRMSIMRVAAAASVVGLLVLLSGEGQAAESTSPRSLLRRGGVREVLSSSSTLHEWHVPTADEREETIRRMPDGEYEAMVQLPVDPADVADEQGFVEAGMKMQVTAHQWKKKGTHWIPVAHADQHSMVYELHDQDDNKPSFPDQIPSKPAKKKPHWLKKVTKGLKQSKKKTRSLADAKARFEGLKADLAKQTTASLNHAKAAQKKKLQTTSEGDAVEDISVNKPTKPASLKKDKHGNMYLKGFKAKKAHKHDADYDPAAPHPPASVKSIKKADNQLLKDVVRDVMSSPTMAS